MNATHLRIISCPREGGEMTGYNPDQQPKCRLTEALSEMTAVRLRPNPRWKAAGRTAVAPRVVSEAEHSAAVMLRHALGANPQARDGARGAVRGENRKRRVVAHPGARRLCSGLGWKNLLDGTGRFFGRDAIGWGEIHTPEARRGREKLHADALA